MNSPSVRATVSLLLALGSLTTASSAAGSPAAPLPRATPESQGVSSPQLLRFVEAVRRHDSLHSLMLVRHGRVVAEGWWAPYRAETRHELYSLSKSFTSTAVGLAVSEGRLSIDDPVLRFFPDQAPPEPSANLKAMRVRDLLTMSTGHQDEPPGFGGAMSVASFLAHPVPHKPGTHFKYNTPATYLQSAIVQKVTGQTVLDYLRPRLFEPLGIEAPAWGASPEGITLGGYGLSIRTEDIARFGQLYLQRGRWNGRALVPADWVDLATQRQVSNGSNPDSDWDQGYGFQFWRCRHHAYRGDGAFGQYCIVLPDLDAVLAITSGLGDMQAVLNSVWDELLPAFHPRRLPRDRAAQNALAETLARLSLPLVEGSPASPAAGRVAGRTYRFPDNDAKIDSLALEPAPDGTSTTLVLRSGDRENRIPCGHRTWRTATAALSGRPEQAVASCGAWTADRTFTARVCLTETPFVNTITLGFEGDTVTLDSALNVGFGPLRQARLTGTAP